MRMWMVDPGLLCRKHLLGEHVECHMLAAVLINGTRSIAGHIERAQLEPQNVKTRHDALAVEMLLRGYRHNSPMEVGPVSPEGHVDIEMNLKDLKSRCPDCRERIENGSSNTKTPPFCKMAARKLL